jgi:hypothetical protein
MGDLLQIFSGFESALARENGNLFPLVQDGRGPAQVGFSRQTRPSAVDIGRVMRKVAFGGMLARDFFLLHVGRDGNVGDAPVCQGRAASQVDQVLDMIGSHSPLVEHSDILEQLIELHVLLGQSSDQVVKMEARQRQHWLTVELGIVQSIQ